MSAPGPLTLESERFRALLESYGSHLSRWPSEVRDAAEAFLAATPEAARWVAVQRELDGWLDSASLVEPSAALLRAVAEIPIRNPQRSWWSRWSPRGAIAALGTAAALGVLVGMATPDQLFDDADAAGDDEFSLTWNGDVADEVLP